MMASSQHCKWPQSYPISTASPRLLHFLQCRSFKPSSSPISHQISIPKSSSSKPSLSQNPSENPIPSTSENHEQSQLTEQLRHLIKCGNYTESIALMESMCAMGYQLDRGLCIFLLGKLRKPPDPDGAGRLVEFLEAEGWQDKHVYNMFITCLCKAGCVVAAVETLGRMRSRGFSPSDGLLNAIVNRLCICKMLEAALAAIEHFRTGSDFIPSYGTYGSLIVCAIVTRGVEEVPALLDQMSRDGLSADNIKMQHMYSRVVCELCTLRKVEEALEFIRYLPNGSGPHFTSYIILLKLLFILGKKKDAESAIDEMLMRVPRLKLTQFRDIVRLLIANGFLRRAREIIDAAVWKFGLGVDMVCCRDLIAAYLEDKRMDLVIELINFMSSLEQYPTVVIYNTIISGLCDIGHTKEAMDVLDNMSSLGVPPNEATYNRIIGGLWSNGEKITAVQMLERMVKEEGLELNVITYNVIMSCLTKDGLVDEGLEVMRVMEGNGVAADVITYNTFLSGFCKAGMMEEAMQLFEEMLNKGCEPHWQTYSIILSRAILAGYKTKVVDLINEMDKMEILSNYHMTLLKDYLQLDHKSNR